MSLITAEEFSFISSSNIISPPIFVFFLLELLLCLQIFFTLSSCLLTCLSYFISVFLCARFSVISHIYCPYPLFSHVQSSYSTHWLFNKNCHVSHFWKFYLVLFQTWMVSFDILIFFHYTFNTLIYFRMYKAWRFYILCLIILLSTVFIAWIMCFVGPPDSCSSFLLPPMFSEFVSFYDLQSCF